MILRSRVIWGDNGVLKDLSEVLNNHISGTIVLPIVAAQDFIYLGADAPFNHRWIEVKTANSSAATISGIHLWDGSTWQPVAEIIDGTLNALSTITLSQSGRIAWVPDDLKSSWARDDTFRSTGDVITGLSTVKIYDMFWVRLTFSANLLAGTELAFTGYKFANDEDLFGLWPEFDTTEALTRFKDGITTYDQVHFESAKQIIRDLKADQVIDLEGQILEWEILRVPAIHKAAEIIYTAFGSDWEAERQSARNRYKEAMKVELFNVDLNSSAKLEVKERYNRIGRMTR